MGVKVRQFPGTLHNTVSVSCRDLNALIAVVRECVKMHKDYGALPLNIVKLLKRWL